MRHTAPVQHALLPRLFVCLSLLAQTLIPQVAAAPAGPSTGGPLSPAGKAARHQSADAADLPDLEEVRRRPQHEPKAVPPVPSKRRRCPPHNPRCNDDLDGAPQMTPTPAPPGHEPRRGDTHTSPAAADTGTPSVPSYAYSPALTGGVGRDDIASAVPASFLTLLTSATNGGRPLLDFSLLDFISGDGGHSVADLSPASTFSPRFAAAATPLAPPPDTNLAIGQPATQSSTLAYNPSGDAWRAVDGNTNGNYTAGSVTHTDGESQPWWEVDLGAVHSLTSVRLWNRTDCCGNNLAGFYVFVSDVPYASANLTATLNQSGVSNYHTAGQGGTPTTVNVNRTGRYVRVQLAATSSLSLAEVEVMGTPRQGIPPAESVAWANGGGVTPSGSSLTKTGGGAAWDAGAMSTRAIASGDGYVEFTASETNTHRMLGLSHGDSNKDYADLDYAIYPAADGTLQVYEAGVNKGTFGAYAAGDRLRVSVVSGVVRYSKNGQTLYTSAAAPRYPLLADASLHDVGATVTSAVISGSLVENVSWTNVAGVTASGNNLTKSGGSGWTTGASSTRTIAGGDGYAEFTAEAFTNRVFGLSRGDSNQSYTDIDFAIYPSDGGGVYVFEGGVNKGQFGTYAAGDRLRVSVEGGQVRYRRNNTLLYTSATAPQYPLLIDTSLHDTGATVHNAVISASLSSQADPGGTGLTGRYYDNSDFTNYKLTRLDYTVDFAWDVAAPASGVGAEEFSVRWTGMVVPRHTETYTFYTYTDDGVRLWVDGQLIIDKWQDQGPTEWTGQVQLEAGRAHAIRMEFYDRFWGATAKLSWSSASQAKEVVPQSRLLPCWKGVGQFVIDFYQAALRREPTSYELQDWTERLAQAQGEARLLAEARALGRALLDSTEYEALNQSDTGRFVADLYWGYLQRAPDAGGLAWWTAQVNLPGHGRGHGLASFEGSIEFEEKVRRLCGAAATSDAGGGDGYNFAAARLDPSNRTEGTDAYSRNYNFSIPLVSLAGRAGLDLGLTLSYNSLVWTKDGTGVTFDADRGTPGPGFRLGLPVVQPKFYNPQTQQYAYLLVTPGGERVELRQAGASNVYESADTSYMQLTEGGGLTLLTADGTQLSFAAAGGEWRCFQVKDRNGNYISAAYYGDGRLWKVTDTPGRVLTFNYDEYQNLLSITQPWRRETEANPNPTLDEAHYWATFGYMNVTLQPLFTNLAVIGEQPGTVIPALSQVGLSDGSYYKFSYNGWGQVWKVTHYAADSLGGGGQPNDTHALSSTRLDLPGSDLQGATAQTDCPRFNEARMWVENGVMNQSAEMITSYSAWSPNMASCEVLAPDGKVKTVDTYATSEWKKGMTTQSVVWAVHPNTNAWEVRRTTTVELEHDGVWNADYFTNPRVTKTTVSDPQGNSRTTRVTYTDPTDFQGDETGYTETDILNVRLPKKVEECADSNCSQPALRTTATDYKVPNLGEYVSRRILGLARKQSLYDGADSAGNLRSQVEYRYDEPDDPQNDDSFLVALPTASPAASQHDGTNYGVSMRWRGNANRVRRYSVGQSNGAVGGYTESRAAYNVTGTLAYAKDAAGHQTSFNYADSFYLNVRRTQPATLQTYAYPTTVTDPDNYTATAYYNYDMGVATETRTPQPNVTVNQPGPLSRLYYDAAGRAIKSLSVNNGAYTRAVYPAKMDAVQTYTLIEEGVEAYAARILDGAGRTRASVRSLPSSSGGYAGQFIDYDQMGRVARQSNPTETNATGSVWAATGADAATGWLYTQTTYDWKGRPLVVTRPDGTTREMDYGNACGCAGGGVVTVKGELVLTGGTPGQARRQQKIHYDVLGRVEKTEVLKWDGASVYSTVVNAYNAFDQVTSSKHYRGGTTGAFQETVRTYDGYGRLKTSREPDQDGPVTYTYDVDDVLLSMTDPRDVVTTYGFTNADGHPNKRHLVNSVSYDLTQATGVAPTPNVRFEYDAAGNRTRMTDGLGRVDYTYDVLSRRLSEKRKFNDPDNASINNVEKTLSYDYNLANQLKHINGPAGGQIDYSYDQGGRLAGVAGSGTLYGGVSDYASGLHYRAWGALKELNYGNGLSLSLQYNSRLQVSRYEVPGKAAMEFHYVTPNGGLEDNDGRVKFMRDLTATNSRFDRLYTYDHVGRLTKAVTGPEARGGTDTDARPFRQVNVYDEWDNITSRTGRHWSQGAGMPTATINPSTNHNQAWVYDEAGNPTDQVDVQNTYDGAGRVTRVIDFEQRGDFAPGLTLDAGYDGDGQRLKHVENGSVKYYVRSTALGGQVVTELDASGQTLRGYVYMGGALLAKQEGGAVQWLHANPVTGSQTPTAAGGASAGRRTELDPLGVDVGTVDWYLFQRPARGPETHTPRYSDPVRLDFGCTLDYLPTDCGLVDRLLRSESLKAEYLTYEPRRESAPKIKPKGSDPTGPPAPTLRFEQMPIVSLGLGLYQTEEPFVERDNEGPGIDWRELIFSFQPPNPTPDEITLQTLKDNCAISAMLDALAYAEGNPGYGTVVRGKVTNSPNDPSLVGKRDVTITDFSRHPNITVQVQKKLYSTAAGRYQFKASTWASLGLSDFSPASQDDGARILMGRRGMIEPLLAGDFAKAVEKGNQEWASLPGSPYGQPTKTLDELKRVYDYSYNTCVSKVLGVSR